MFTSIIDNKNYFSNCIVCQKPLHFYVAGYQKTPFHIEEYIYCKTKIKDCFLISCNKKCPFKINILTNEILKGEHLLEEMLAIHLDFYLKCPTCVFQINFHFKQNQLIDGKILPSSSVLKEELVYHFHDKKISVHTGYEKMYKYSIGSSIYHVNNSLSPDADSSTYIYSGRSFMKLPRLNLKKFKNLKKLNNYINTLLILT